MGNYAIIGASTGTGRALAQQLAAQGHQVFGTYHKHATEDQQGIRYTALNVLEETTDWSFLPATLDGLAYCVGAIPLKPFPRLALQAFRDDYELQVLGAVKSIQAALPALKASGSGSIVLYSTVAVQTGFPFHSIVSASKGALEGLVRALAAELAPSIRVNAIAPSLTETPLAQSLLGTPEKRDQHAGKHPMKRIGQPEDLAHMAAFLLGPQSTWISGQILHVDGGMGAIK